MAEQENIAEATPPSGGMLLPSNESSLLINELSEAIVATQDSSGVLAVAVDKVKQLLGADEAALVVIDAVGDQLTFDRILAVPPDTERVPALEGHGLSGWVARHLKPVLVSDVTSDPRWVPVPEWTLEVRSVVAVPLFIGSDLCGVLEAAASPKSPPFGAEALEALLWLAPHLALAIKNSRNMDAIRRANEGLERKVEERTAELVLAKKEWERTFDSISEPLFVLHNYTVRLANFAVARASGVMPSNIVGETCHKILGGRDQRCDGCPLAAGETSGEVTLRGRVYRCSYFPIESGGMVAHYRDVTEARQLEDQLRESQRMASVGQLAAGAAHEINNPLGFLMSNLTMLESYLGDVRRSVARVEEIRSLALSGEKEKALKLLADPNTLPPQVLESLEECPQILRESRDGGRRVHEIVKALKELAARDTVGNRASEDLEAIVDRAVRRAAVPIERVQRGHRQTIHAVVEPMQLEIAVANVLRNALQASDDSSPIVVDLVRENDQVTLTVRDSGCGMNADVRARAFDPFFTTRGIGGGLGLGLTAAYGIVARHRGTITIASEPGKGTQVVIRFPAA